MEIKIQKEVRLHKETLFFGLFARRFFCSALAVGVAVAGFFQYNGLSLEQFLWAFVKSGLLCVRPKMF